MARQNINLGTKPDGDGGDDVRGAFTKTNANFEELYTEAPQTEAQAGTASTIRGWTARRVFDAIKSWTAKNLGSAAKKDVGDNLGNLLESKKTVPTLDWRTGWFRTTDVAASSIQPWRTVISAPFGVESDGQWTGNFIAFSSSSGACSIHTINYGKTLPVRNVYDTLNTTVASDGTLKAASPIIKLFNNKHEIENESEFGLTPSVVKLSTGTYEITNTLGLRSDSWFLDTPQDRNGNKYFNVDYEQTTGTVVDGVLDAGEIDSLDDLPKLDPSTVIIKCFERVWNPKTGIFENGDPVDIKDGRYITLRFNELQYTIKPTDHESVAKGKK